MELENEKTESVNENVNKGNKNVDEFQPHFAGKTGKHKSKNTKRHEGVECHIIHPLFTKLVRSRWLDIGLVLFLRLGP